MITSVLRDNAAGHWLFFEKPLAVITAHRPEDVLPALREVERRVESEQLHAAGFVCYEAAPAFDPALTVRPSAAVLPLLRFTLHPAPRTHAALPEPFSGRAPVTLDWAAQVTRPEYDAAVGAIREHIARGDTYQVNYTTRLQARFDGDPWSWFLQLAAAQRSQHAAWIDSGRHVILSASPELFFRLDGNVLTARPMKGTAPRAPASGDDRARAAALRGSMKDRAENVMIVDMMRNDIGRIADTGSVRVPRLFELEQYPTVWQLTSTIEARAARPFDQIFGALFPPASVTGAPKPRTMGIIADLETTPRGIYTGAIGHLSPGRRYEFNVAIRTVLLDRETSVAEYGVGGGIVWDSDAASEFEECRAKARVLAVEWPRFALLETLRWSPRAGYDLLDEHLRRLCESARYFGYPCDLAAVSDHLAAFARDLPPLAHRVRFLLHEDGTMEVEAAPLDETAGDVRVVLADEPVNSNDPFLYHKTTHRPVYEAALAGVPAGHDVILWNERGEITESTRANVVIELAGERFTPPVSAGLLAGTFRQRLIEQGAVRERTIARADLARADAVWLVNSVRGWRRAILDPAADPAIAVGAVAAAERGSVVAPGS